MSDQVDWRALEREASPGRAVGRLLRDQREARGQSLDDIAKLLRIRQQQLAAIEDGRFDLLPGAAYIPAFLRAYATHLELDPEKILSAYHLSGPVPIKRPVALPADFSVADRRAPIGLAVLTVLLVVAAGYVAWHYLPREQTVVAEKVPPVPDRLMAPAPGVVEASKTVVSAPSVRESTSATGTTLPPDTWPATRLDAAGAPAAPVAPPIVVAVPTPPPPVVMTPPGIGQAQAAQAPESQEARNPAPVTEQAVATPAPPPIVATRVDTPVSVRIDSWVELRAPNGDVLAKTYVRAGESYVVPAGISYRVIEAR